MKSYFPLKSAFLFFEVVLSFPICTGMWRVNNFVFPPQEGINRRTEDSTPENFIQALLLTSYSYFIVICKTTLGNPQSCISNFNFNSNFPTLSVSSFQP